MPYKSDQEFMAHVGHLLAKPQVQRLKENFSSIAFQSA